MTGIKLQAKDAAVGGPEERRRVVPPIAVQGPGQRQQDHRASSTRCPTMRAKEFVAESKNAEDLKKCGLDKPEYQVTLALPKANKELDVRLP